MRFLADESCDFGVVKALRAEGHDVTAIVEMTGGISDDSVAEIALREGRVLLTEDKDFGHLVYVRSTRMVAVILIRFRASARPSLPGTIAALVRDHADRIVGAFVVVEPGRVRISRLPALPDADGDD